MQQDGQNAKQLIVERVKNSTNILVTVSTNPSVDALSAALGFTLMLNKMDKHGTAVFSGQIPPAIAFLDPAKTFENTVDSLRDFIIALDKEKADRLRYKVEGDLVRIFITPYRTTISEKDLQFSQGDFNVDLVIALGVEKREELDAAIVAHGRILHDATVATINARTDHNGLGSVDWQDPNASSLCEMLMSLSEALQPGLLDQQISTALLTGIVANTDRFSNSHTSPRVMTMAAQLMAAGANQQLISTKLQEGNVVGKTKDLNVDGTTPLAEGQSSKVAEPAKPKEPGEIEIEHPGQANSQQPAPLPAAAPLPPPLPPYPSSTPQPMPTSAPPPPTGGLPIPGQPSEDEIERELDEKFGSIHTPAAAAPDLAKALQDEAAKFGPAPPPPPQQFPAGPPPAAVPPSPVNPNPQPKPSWMGKRIEPPHHGNAHSNIPAEPPMMGGALSATSEQAMEDKKREEEDRRNHALLTHDEHAEQPVMIAPLPPPAGGVGPASPTPQPAPAAQADSLFDDKSDFIETPVTPRDNPAVGGPPPPPAGGLPPLNPPAPTATQTASQPEPVTPLSFAPPPAVAPPLPPQLSEPANPQPAAAPSAPPAPAAPPTPPEPINPGNAPLTLEELERRAHQQIQEATSLAAPAEQVANDLDNARRAVDQAFISDPFNGGNDPLQAQGATPLPDIQHRSYASEAPSTDQSPVPLTDSGLSMPDFNDMPDAPGAANVNSLPPSSAPLATEPAPDATVAPVSDPTQPQASSGLGTFKIPGQS